MKNWLKVFSFFLIAEFLLYANSLFNKFLIDDFGFLNNPLFSNPKYLWAQWNPYREEVLGIIDHSQHISYYRPLTHMLYDLIYGTFKNNLWEYHLLNIFLFVLAASLIYGFVAKITGNKPLAFLTGFFYLIHPINGIMIDYISANVFAMQIICTMLTINLLLISLERGKNIFFYALSVLCGFSSLLWHESGVMMPLYLSAVVFLFRKDAFKQKMLYLFPYFLIVLLYLVFWTVFLNNHVAGYAAHLPLTLGQYLSSLSHIYYWYISRLFYPQGIVLVWATPVLQEHVAFKIFGLVVLMTLFFLLFKFLRQNICRLGLLWLGIGFAPVVLASYRDLQDGVTIEPHWFVISSIGFFILIAYSLLLIMERWKIIGAVIMLVLIFGWATVSRANNLLWANQITYCLYWSKEVPSLKSTYAYLAKAYQDEGKLKEAKGYYKKTLTGGMLDLITYVNLSNIDIQQKHYKEAERSCKLAISLDPYSAVAYNNLSNVYYAQGQLDKSRSSAQMALKLNPYLMEPRRELAFIAIKKGSYSEAVSWCLKNLEIVPNDTGTLLLLISIYTEEKDYISLQKYVNRFVSSETDPHIIAFVRDFLSRNHVPEALVKP